MDTLLIRKVASSVTSFATNLTVGTVIDKIITDMIPESDEEETKVEKIITYVGKTIVIVVITGLITKRITIPMDELLKLN